MAFLTPDKVFTVNGVTVKEFLLTKHNPNKIDMPSKRIKPLAGITIHNTDVIKVNGTTMAEQYTRATYNGNMNSVRVHYYVDDKEAWHNLPDTWQGWHAADGSGGGNTSTIAIECIMSKTGYEKSEDNCARLTAYLLYSNGLTTANVFTHTYWLNVRDGKGANLNKDERCVLAHPYKVCPIYIIPHWKSFIAKVDKYLADLKSSNKVGIVASSQVQSKVLYTVQTGAFSVRENAEAHLKEVQKYFPNAYIKINK